MKKSSRKLISLLIILTLFVGILSNTTSIFAASAECAVDLTNLKVTVNGEESNIKTYSQEEFNSFISDYSSGNLPQIYVTEFLYDGVGMVKTPDLDDFIDGASNDTEVKTLSIKVINVNTAGNVTFSGEITGGMIAVNTNSISGDINLILNGVKIDTDSKKAPAVYVYNKNINYTDHKVTIKTVQGTQNYLEGGKFKKVSLVGSDELTNYSNYYSGDAKTNYLAYTNYYGIYTKAQIDDILFAKVTADGEDLQDGDPYYFYKGAGAISSDIDLYFEGEGYLSVISKNKEGIETKGNLTMQGGTGDYYIFAEDDCLNTTTSSQGNNNARNTLTINVNSLTAMVDSEADEGDCIDSNGTLVIEGGTILAFAHPTSQDDGLDSEKGTYINGGIVAAVGNMSDSILDTSSQDFIKLNFASRQDADTLICVTDTNNIPVMAFRSDRTFTTLTLSSPELAKQTYYVYKGGTIVGEETNGLYTTITSYEVGTRQQWTSGGNRMGGMMQPNMRQAGNSIQGGMTPPDMNQNGNNIQGGMTPPDMNQNGNNIQGGMTPPDMNQNGNNIQGGMTPLDMNQNGNNIQGGITPPDMNQNGNNIQGGMTPPDMNQNGNNIQGGMTTLDMNQSSETETSSEASIEFTISSQSHTFNNVTDYTGTATISNNPAEENITIGNMQIEPIVLILIIGLAILLVVLVIILIIIKSKNKK